MNKFICDLLTIYFILNVVAIPTGIIDSNFINLDKSANEINSCYDRTHIYYIFPGFQFGCWLEEK